MTRDEFIDKWADKVVPTDGQGVVQVVRTFCDELDSVIATERRQERRNLLARKKGVQGELTS